MGPGYTELFFLDEVTALAAGHRPCFECRRRDAHRFAVAWQQAFNLAEPPMADDMDRVLHRERGVSGMATRPMVEVATLPDGVVIRSETDMYAVYGDLLLRWTFEGYVDRVKRTLAQSATLLTPPAIVTILAAGYQPVWHQTATRI